MKTSIKGKAVYYMILAGLEETPLQRFEIIRLCPAVEPHTIDDALRTMPMQGLLQKIPREYLPNQYAGTAEGFAGLDALRVAILERPEA